MNDLSRTEEFLAAADGLRMDTQIAQIREQQTQGALNRICGVLKRAMEKPAPDLFRDIREGIELMGYDYWLDGEQVDDTDMIMEFKSPTHPAIEVRIKGV